jgi:tetratricopeptide (TPR) repeat protein
MPRSGNSRAAERRQDSTVIRRIRFCASLLAALLACAAAAAQEPAEQQERIAEAENELHLAIELAGNDRAALVRNLEDYLRRFPDAPRRVQVFRALVEASLHLGDLDRAVDYAERIIALRPDDNSMLLLAVDLLEQRGDPASLTRAVGYVTRVLDRVEKMPVGSRPAVGDDADGDLEQRQLLMTVYLIRGRLEIERRNYAAARADLEASSRTLPTPAAALRLGDLAEVAGDYARALAHYTDAFVLPDHHGLGIDRLEVRRKMGNAWRLRFGTEEGLGEHILAAYDRVYAEQTGEVAVPRNAAASALGDFRLRRVGGGEFPLAELAGKVAVLNFSATWSLPSRELKTIFESAAGRFEDRDDVMFLTVAVDEDEASVEHFAARERLRTPVVFAGGLDTFLGVRAIPTVLVLGRDGRVLFRAEGYAPAALAQDLENAVRHALAAEK